MKIFCFNGPPGSGKDTIVDLLIEKLPNKKIVKLNFKDKIFDIASVLYDIDVTLLKERNSIRELKELPWELIGNKSIRQLLIHVSENIVKPNFDKSYFGHSVAKQIIATHADLILIADCGFSEEVNALHDYGLEFTVIRIHRDGCTFSNDSRNYINLVDTNIIDVYNNGTIDQLLKQILEIINENSSIS